jgi:hypothetical protein
LLSLFSGLASIAGISLKYHNDFNIIINYLKYFRIKLINIYLLNQGIGGGIVGVFFLMFLLNYNTKVAYKLVFSIMFGA